jgi:RNA polymerase sigma factor (sigma-70 family)
MAQNARNAHRYLLQALEHESALRSCLYGYTRSEADVDELLQVVYGRLWAKGASGDSEVRSVRAFALTVARNVVVDWVRHCNLVPIVFVPDVSELSAEEYAPAAETVASRNELIDKALQVALRLSDSCREIYLLHHVEGYTIPELAENLALSEQEVRGQLNKALRETARLLLNPPGAPLAVDCNAKSKEEDIP